MLPLDRITNSLLKHWRINHDSREEVSSCIKVGYFEALNKSEDGGYIYATCNHKVIDWIRKQYGWQDRLQLSTKLNCDSDDCFEDLLCDVRPNALQLLIEKEELVIEEDSNIKEQIKNLRNPFRLYSRLTG